MAIKIDLLPGYVPLQRWVPRAVIASLVILGVAGSILATLQKQKQLELETLQADLEMFQGVAAKTTAAQTSTTELNNKRGSFDNAIAFMTAASKTGSERAALVNLLRRYIYENSVVNSIDISDGQNVIIRATVRDPNEYARFLFNLRRAADPNGVPLFASPPTAAGPGGFANGAVPFVQPVPDSDQPIVILYPIAVEARGVLKNPIVLPPDPVGGAAPAAGAPGGPPPGGPPPGV